MQTFSLLTFFLSSYSAVGHSLPVSQQTDRNPLSFTLKVHLRFLLRKKASNVTTPVWSYTLFFSQSARSTLFFRILCRSGSCTFEEPCVFSSDTVASVRLVP